MKIFFEYRIIRGGVDMIFETAQTLDGTKAPLRADDEVLLNELGANGWELVGFHEGTGRPEGGIGSKRMLYFLKRAHKSQKDYEIMMERREEEISEMKKSIEKTDMSE